MKQKDLKNRSTREKKKRLKEQKKPIVAIPLRRVAQKLKIKFNFKTRHNSVIMKEREERIEHFTLTHSAETDGKKNKKLSKNPNPKDNKDSFIVNKLKKNTPEDFSKKERDGWSIAEEDEKMLKKIYENKKGRQIKIN